jgi:tetratricopeptide (TPR) repeat protein
VADFNAALKVHAGLPIAYLCRAICYHKYEQYAEALADYSAALATHAPQPGGAAQPWWRKALANRALVHWHLGEYAEAAIDYRELLEAADGSAGAADEETGVLLALGLCMCKQRELVHAVPPARTAQRGANHRTAGCDAVHHVATKRGHIYTAALATCARVRVRARRRSMGRLIPVRSVRVPRPRTRCLPPNRRAPRRFGERRAQRARRDVGR